MTAVSSISKLSTDDVKDESDKSDEASTDQNFMNSLEDSQNEVKKRKISQVLEREPVNVGLLKQLAISRGGLVSDDLRIKAWPQLIDVDISNILRKPDQEVLHGHRDYNQVVMDVNRSLKRFPPGMDENVRLGLQDQLVDLIMRVLVNHDELHYYQGYHDICVTFLLVVGEDLAFAVVDKLSLNHLRDFMDADMDRTKHMLNYLYPIVRRANPELNDFMEQSEVGTIFSLSWLITWYGHVLNDISNIVRCYDFFIACHPLMPIYLAAAIVLHREREIMESECDMCMLHGLLSKIPDDLPFEQLITKAGDLFLQYPPETLASEAEASFQKQQDLAKARIQNRTRGRRKDVQKRRWSSLLFQDGRYVYVKVTFWTVTAVVSAAAIAYFKSNSWNWLW